MTRVTAKAVVSVLVCGLGTRPGSRGCACGTPSTPLGRSSRHTPQRGSAGHKVSRPARPGAGRAEDWRGLGNNTRRLGTVA